MVEHETKHKSMHSGSEFDITRRSVRNYFAKAWLSSLEAPDTMPPKNNDFKTNKGQYKILLSRIFFEKTHFLWFSKNNNRKTTLFILRVREKIQHMGPAHCTCLRTAHLHLLGPALPHPQVRHLGVSCLFQGTRFWWPFFVLTLGYLSWW